MQTENECGDGENTWFYARYVFNLYQHYFTNGVNAYIYWNMVLEPKGRSTWGWEQNAMLTVDKEKKAATRNPEFYVMKHFAHFTSPNDRRVGLKGPWAGNAVAFEKPDGTRIIVLTNPFKDTRELRLSIDSKQQLFRLEPESFHTIIIPRG